MTGHDRTGQDRTGQDRTEKNRTGHRTGQNRTEKDRTGQDRAKNRTEIGTEQNREKKKNKYLTSCRDKRRTIQSHLRLQHTQLVEVLSVRIHRLEKIATQHLHQLLP